MFRLKRAVLVGLVLSVAVAGCADAAGSRTPAQSVSPAQGPAAGAAVNAKRMVAAVMAVQKTLNVRSIGPGRPMGFDALENKPNFLELPYWREEFVGTGPYKLREWTLNSHVVLDANDRYVLGRPQVDVVEVRFIPDANTLVANIRAGEVELTMGRALSLDQALQLRDQWRDGKLDISLDRNWLAIYPQMINPSPRVIGDVPFRRALVHAIDRQEMVATIQHGLVPVADTIVGPNEPEYKDIERSIVRYTYEPRMGAQILGGLGYTMAPDSTFRDAANQRLGVELRTTGGDGSEKSMLAVADYWQRVGVGSRPSASPARERTTVSIGTPGPASSCYNSHSSWTAIAAHRCRYPRTASRGRASTAT